MNPLIIVHQAVELSEVVEGEKGAVGMELMAEVVVGKMEVEWQGEDGAEVCMGFFLIWVKLFEILKNKGLICNIFFIILSSLTVRDLLTVELALSVN